MPDDSQKDANQSPNDVVPDGNEIPASMGELASKMPKIISFDQLARCGEEIWIECNGQIYRLRRTRQGKLILTK